MRRRSLACALIAVVIIGAAAQAGAAVGDYLGRNVGSVQLDIEGRPTTDSKLFEMVETRVGRPLSMLEVRESLTHLFSLNRFEDVRVHASLVDGSVALRYELVPTRRVARIQFAGTLDAPGVDEGRLHHVVLDRYGASPPLGRAAEVAEVVVGALHERGYLHARVMPHVEIQRLPERATLVLTVESGPRTTIGSIDINGAPLVTRNELLERLDIAPGRPHQREALGARIGDYVANLRARGFYEARIDPVVRLTDDDRVANLTLNVTPGPHVRVVFTGDALPAARRDEFVPIAREGSADEDLLEDSTKRIEEYLQSQGYRDATAPHTRAESDGELLITFAVRKGPQYRVSHVEVSGNASIPSSEFAATLRLRDGQLFAVAQLDSDISTIEDFYLRRGFASARAQATIVDESAAPGAAQIPVLVRIAVREGVRTVVGTVRFDGNRSVSDATLGEGLGLRGGQPFVAAQVLVDRDAVQLAYMNRGYQRATVGARPQFSPDGTTADIVHSVREGPQIFVNHVLIAGNVRTRTETIERELRIKAGDPLGLAAVLESQRRLASLGLYRRVRIGELSHGDETTRDLLVTVEETPATSVGYGGGGEMRLRVVRRATDGGIAAQRMEFAPRASFEIVRRNLFGGNRSINFFTSVSLHPADSPYVAGQTISSSDSPPVGHGFTEYRVLATYREPGVFHTSADAFVTGLLEQQIRSSFNFARRSATVEIARHLTRNVSLSGSYQIQSTRVFDQSFSQEDALLIDRIFPQFRLSSFQSSLIRDTRDDPVNPSIGHYLSANAQLAMQAVGSEVGFVKSFLTAQAFRVVPRTNHVVFAADARLGLSHGFRRVIPGGEEIQQLPASERFFAGGDTTVRGFALDTLGTAETIDKNGFPIGGNGLVILNAELRAPIRGGLGIVGFFDTGNVFAQVTDIDFGELRGAVGFGLRYKSPIGPLRIDVGFKLSRRELTPGRREGLTALHVSFGQAF